MATILYVAAPIPAAAAAQVRIGTDVTTTPRRGEPGLKPNSFCGPTDDPVQCQALVDLYNATNGDKWTTNTYRLAERVVVLRLELDLAEIGP
jgi:hypothetical protein